MAKESVPAFMSVTEAAQELALTRQSFWQQIKTGGIKATKIGETYVVSVAEIKKIRRNRIVELEKRISQLRELEKGAK